MNGAVAVGRPMASGGGSRGAQHSQGPKHGGRCAAFPFPFLLAPSVLPLPSPALTPRPAPSTHHSSSPLPIPPSNPPFAPSSASIPDRPLPSSCRRASQLSFASSSPPCQLALSLNPCLAVGLPAVKSRSSPTHPAQDGLIELRSICSAAATPCRRSSSSAIRTPVDLQPLSPIDYPRELHLVLLRYLAFHSEGPKCLALPAETWLRPVLRRCNRRLLWPAATQKHSRTRSSGERMIWPTPAVGVFSMSSLITCTQER